MPSHTREILNDPLVDGKPYEGDSQQQSQSQQLRDRIEGGSGIPVSKPPIGQRGNVKGYAQSQKRQSCIDDGLFQGSLQSIGVLPI